MLIILASVVIGMSVLGLIAFIFVNVWDKNNVKTISGVHPHVLGEVSVLPGIAMTETTDDTLSQVVLNSDGVWNITVLHNLSVSSANHAVVLENNAVRDLYASAGIAVAGGFYKTIFNTGVLSVTCTGAGMNCTNTTGDVAIGTTAILTVNGITPDSNGDTTLSGYYGLITDNGPGPHGNQVWHELTRRKTLTQTDPNGNVIAYVTFIPGIQENTWRQWINPGFNPIFIPGLYPGDGGAGDVGGSAWQPAYEGLYTINVMTMYTVSIDYNSHQSVNTAICFDCTSEDPFSGNTLLNGGLQTMDINTGIYASFGPTIFMGGVHFMSLSTTFEVCSTCPITIGSVLTLHVYHSHSSTNLTSTPVNMDAQIFFEIAQVI
jgi:hypothetical protein